MASPIARGMVLVDRYRVDGQLGAGGMGTVWAATELRTKRAVAVKVIREDIHSRAELRKRILREARAASAVAHPNVVEVFDVFSLEGDRPALVMERLEGETLADLLQREETLTLARCADLLVPALSAVGTAHARGIVHRDLKPANIFLARAPGGGTTVKVVDFGIAKLFVADGQTGPTQLTGTGSTIGTPSYMAPEQATGAKDVDHQADVWAFGVILYECLSGIRPIEGDSIGQVVMSLMSTGITPLECLVPSLPEDTAGLVGRMLSRDRTLRPSDLREPFDILQRHGSVTAPPFSAPASVPIDADAGLPELPLAPEARRPSEAPRAGARSRGVAMALGLVAAASAAVAFVGGKASTSDVAMEPKALPVASVITPAATVIVTQPAGPLEARVPDPLPANVVQVPSASPPLAPPKAASSAKPSEAPVRTIPASHKPAPAAAPAASQDSFRGGLAEEIPF